MDCDIDARTLRCRRCGGRVSSASVRRNCHQEAIGLGDFVASGLAALGLTKERAQAISDVFGIRDCGCRRRQQQLNELGRRIGVGGPED